MKTAALLLVLVCATARAETPLPVGAPMPEFDVERWLNSPPLTVKALRGKVVLVDFWEYTCVNCIRTLPFVKAWWTRYAPQGLVVVGVHAPEFGFGKRKENIERGVRDHGLTYPIALDNDYATWTAFHNNAWPAKYLFDAEGKLAGAWFGEGDYAEVEAKIRELLGKAHPGLKLPPVTDEVAHFGEDYSQRAGLTPETYLGTARREAGAFKLEGSWGEADEYVEHKGTGEGRIVMDVVAGEVNLVMEPGPAGHAEVGVILDGKPFGVARFDRSGMIRLVAKAGKKPHKLVLVTHDPGLRAYAFTFGP